MKEPGSSDYEPPAPGETLRQWVAGSSRDWLESQATMWMPAVPARPTAPPPSIPRQRGPQHTARRRPRPGATSGSIMGTEAPARTEPGTAARRARSDPGPSPDRRGRALHALYLAAVLIAVLAVGMGVWTLWAAGG